MLWRTSTAEARGVAERTPHLVVADLNVVIRLQIVLRDPLVDQLCHALLE